MCFFCVCVVLCLARGLATSRSLVQRVLPSVKWSWSWKSEVRAQGGCRASEKIKYSWSQERNNIVENWSSETVNRWSVPHVAKKKTADIYIDVREEKFGVSRIWTKSLGIFVEKQILRRQSDVGIKRSDRKYEHIWLNICIRINGGRTLRKSESEAEIDLDE
jgi:hypothetical protein